MTERAPPPPQHSKSSQARHAVIPRDQDTSSFTKILDQLVRSTPGAEAAALVDWEGETVDYAGRLDTFDLKVAAATWTIALAELRETKHFSILRDVTVRSQKRSFYVRQVHPGYAVIVILHRHAAFAMSERALREVDAQLAREAEWPRPRDDVSWFAIGVEPAKEDRTRPFRVRVGGEWKTIEVLGSVVGLRRGERGFRIRIASGHEILLVRERLGRWFADERVD